MTQAVPHIGFDGKAEEAFNFYRGVFGGDLAISKWKENPGCDQWSEKDKNLVMHASLSKGQLTLMGNDVPKAMGEKVTEGNNFTVTVLPDSRAEADHTFSALSDGGTSRMPMQDMFWGDYFGALTDKFGVQWMINYHQADKK